MIIFSSECTDEMTYTNSALQIGSVKFENTYERYYIDLWALHFADVSKQKHFALKIVKID